MNREELLAQKYLESLNPASIVFEPDGNIPPDFLVNGKIAVEVTRLSEHIEVNGVLKCLDDDNISIIAFIKNVLQGFDSKLQNISFWVNIYIKRPFGNRKKVKKALLKLLSSFESPDAVLSQYEYSVSDGLIVAFMKGTYASNQPVFRLGIISEHDMGGWVYDDMVRNIGCCIQHKTAKIKPYQARYNVWWLILIDSIAFGCYSELIDDFKAVIHRGGFDKVVVLDAESGNYIFEI